MTRSDPANKFHLLWYLHSVRLPPVIFSPRHFLRVSNTWAAGPVRASSRAYTDLHGGQLYAYMRMI